MILSQAQARAVYDAMCALNNVSAASGMLRLVVPLVINGEYEKVEICETDVEVLRVSVLKSDRKEYFAGQDGFARAFGL